MSARYLGSLTLADLIPGAAQALERLRSASAALSLALSAQIPALEGVGLALDAAVLAEVRGQLEATLAAGASLSLVDPTVQIGAIVSGAISAIANLQATPPSVQLSAQVAANAALAVQLEAKKLALQAILEPLNLALQAFSELLDPLSVALRASAAFNVRLAAPGVRAYRVESTLGAALDEVKALISAGQTDGLGSSTSVQGVVLVVDQGNATTTAALNATFTGAP